MKPSVNKPSDRQIMKIKKQKSDDDSSSDGYISKDLIIAARKK